MHNTQQTLLSKPVKFVQYLNFMLDIQNVCLFLTKVVQLNFDRLQTRKLCQSPLLVFLSPSPEYHLTSKSHYWSPRALWAAGWFHQPITLSPKPSPRRTILLVSSADQCSVDAGSQWITVKQAFKTEVFLKLHSPICLDYRACNRPHLFKMIKVALSKKLLTIVSSTFSRRKKSQICYWHLG